MNPKLLLCLALVLGGGLVGCSTNAPYRPIGLLTTLTSPWGVTEDGLRCRITLPVTIEQGMNVPAAVELQADPAQLPAGMRKLNTLMPDAFLTLRLTDANTGKQFEIKPFSYSGPVVPHTDHDSLALSQPLKAWKVNFPLVTVYSNLAPADYTCQVIFSCSTNQPNWALKDEGFDSSSWYGTIMSGNVHLHVLPETPRFQTFRIPKRLVVTKELINLHTPDQPPDLADIPMIRFHRADAQTVNLQVRNGHFICTSIERRGQSSFFGVQALLPDDNPIGGWYDYKGQDLTADYQIEVFEVGVPGGHLMISGPFSAGYRSLWSRTFHVSMTAKQFRELPATVVNVPSGSDDRECVALIQANPEVEELKLENTGITDADMALVRRLHHLRVLFLYGTHITDAGLAQLRTMTGLRTLNLDGTEVTDAGVLGLRRLTELEKLGLGNTSITDNGAAVVSRFPHLKQLDFWNTRIGDMTVARVSELKQLEWLELRGTKVTNEGAQDLTNLVHLRDLRLPTTVTDKDLEVLNRALPNCSVLMQ